MKNIISLLFYFSLAGIISCTQHVKTPSTVSIIPLPHTIDLTTDRISILRPLDYSNVPADLKKIATFFQNQVSILFPSKSLNHKNSLPILFKENIKLEEEAYTIRIQKERIEIEASGRIGYIRAIATLLQLVDDDGTIALGFIDDAPDYDYRSVMIDCSRSWYSVATLKQIIDLCFWYKIKHVHLHLTDDALFTFPSTTFPKLASDQSYTRAELNDLNEYANDRGCILIPEIDLPGHASNFVSKYPEQFALQDKQKNYWTINMGKPSAYDAIALLLAEVAEAFPYSPYIHIGGDEVNKIGMDDDPDIKRYMASHNIATLDDLYHHFITTISKQVNQLGKQTIIWSDFTNKGATKIPSDIIVMVWKTGAYHPDDLVNDDFEIINASWQPLYVVNNRKWTSKEIYQWNPSVWKASQTTSDHPGVKMQTSKKLKGGSMSVWEQNEYKAISSLRGRLASMSERLWNQTASDYNSFENRLAKIDSRLDHFLYGFTLEEKGLSYPDWSSPNFSEQMYFSDSLIISASTFNKDHHVGYKYFSSSYRKRTLPDVSTFHNLEKPLTIKKGGPIMFQSFKKQSDGKRKAIGHPIFKNYSLHPVMIEARELLDNYKPHNWEHHKFIDSVLIRFTSSTDDDIYYTTDYTLPSSSSIKYTSPFYLTDDTYIKAQLLSKKSGEAIGKPSYQEYVRLGLENSLSTDKPITTSNGKNELGVTNFINDGKIARWDHWGDHTDGDNWIIIDLEEEKMISRFKTYTFWDGFRYYEYSIEVSTDNKTWKMVVDKGDNKELSTREGITDIITPISARYIKLNLISNSANPGLHLVEFNVFKH